MKEAGQAPQSTPSSNDLLGQSIAEPIPPLETRYEKRAEGEAILKSPRTESDLYERFRSFQDATLRFLSTASNETLGVCALGLGVSTYLVLGRVGLVLIGAVGGVVLHATWEGSLHGDGDATGKTEAARRRKEQALEIATRALRWRDTSKASNANGSDEIHKIEPSVFKGTLDYTGFPAETSKALTVLTDAIVRDYVKYWYSPLLPADESFPSASRQTLTSFILSFANHVSRKRTEDPFLDFLANSTSIIIVFLNELSNALRASPNQTVEDAINTYLRYAPDSSLANVLSEQQQQRKLSIVSEDILQSFLESKTYNCAPARAFLREVLAGLILQGTVANCSRAEWINEWIVYLLEEGEPEILNAIDAGVEDLGQGMEKVKEQVEDDPQGKRHQRRISKAEEAMEQAMLEAQRINAMIAEEETRKKRGITIPEADDPVSSSTTETGIPTPTSSDSDRGQLPEMVFDIEGNAIPSGASSPAKLHSPTGEKAAPDFSSLDQAATQPTPIEPRTTDTPPPPTETMVAIPLTLHNASLSLLDLGTGNDKVLLKQKPDFQMMIQIEPASGRYPGWMVTRRYVEYESLHETLRRIAVVSGIPEFAEFYPTVPEWKGHSRSSLIEMLEVYLKAALRHERLAESGAMKRFLEKSTGLDKIAGSNKNVLLQGAAALDNVGKGFVNVLGQGGKGIADGGKAVFGGVSGVFGAVKGNSNAPRKPDAHRNNSSVSRVPTAASVSAFDRSSLDLSKTSSESGDNKRPSLITRTSNASYDRQALSVGATHKSQESLSIPTVSSKLSGEYVRHDGRSSEDLKTPVSNADPQEARTPVSAVSAPGSEPDTPGQSLPNESAHSSPQKGKPRKGAPLTEEETRITVDLMFAIITSTYSLSSAWTIRLSLLTAAKTFLLRPNNPQLDSIRTLLQESLVNANTSDNAIAGHVLKLRENTLPTDEERAKWPAELSEKEKDDLRVKARRLLVERGMPQALTSVMGQAASGEALGKVFDCLQQPKVAQGFIFALMLQALKALTQ